MLIAMDVNEIHTQATGIGRYLGHQTQALLNLAERERSDVRFLFFQGRRPLPFDLAGRPFVRMNDRWINVKSTIVRSCWAIPKTLAREERQIFYSANHAPFSIPGANTRFVATVHDIIPLQHPHYFRLKERLISQWALKKIIRTAHHIAVDTEEVRGIILDYFKLGTDRVSLVHPGISRAFRPAAPSEVERARAAYKIPRPYVLAVSTVEPRKNLKRVIQAFLRSGLGKDFVLVIVGGKGWQHQEIMKEADPRFSGDAVLFTGYVPDADLVPLYSGARSFVYPSLQEGFGFPVLESMACGTPVITSNCSSLPEVCGDAGIQVDPLSVEAIGDALRRLLGSEALQAELRRKGLERAARYDWDRNAREMLEIFRKAGAN